MYRKAIEQLAHWAANPHRSPLLIRGARQVGKTYLVEHCAKNFFEHVITINFEFQPECLSCFESLDPEAIIKKLQLETGQVILKENTLLFLDEIQECPQAILALRYFKEKMPQLPVIAAGSLLEFTLNDENFRMPVGRVEFLYLYPLSFREFLKAIDEDVIIDWIAGVTLGDTVSPSLHTKCLGLVRDYCFIGGMPDAVKFYRDNRTDFSGIQNQQAKLLQAYNLDFGKYAKTKNQNRFLQIVFDKLSDFVSRQVTYSKIDMDSSSRDIKNALNMLRLAGLCKFIYSSTGEGIPLKANINFKKFKLLYLDVGLYLRDLGLNLSLLNNTDLELINSGALAEQYVGQELLSLSPATEMAQLYFWARDRKSSQAEVDYLYQHGAHVLPVEVKAGATGSLKSLHIFKEAYQSKLGLRISSRSLSLDGGVLSVPFYLISELDRLLAVALH